MKIKTPKYRRMVLLSFLLFLLIGLFEIIPGYYDLGLRLVSAIVHNFSQNNKEELSSQLSMLREETILLKKKYSEEFLTSENNYNLSSALESINVSNREIGISINSIKPLKKIKKGGLDFQKTSMSITGDFESIYNYCRWLEVTGSTIEFDELIISNQKESGLLQSSLLLDILYSGMRNEEKN